MDPLLGNRDRLAYTASPEKYLTPESLDCGQSMSRSKLAVAGARVRFEIRTVQGPTTGTKSECTAEGAVQEDWFALRRKTTNTDSSGFQVQRHRHASLVSA